MNDLAFVLRAGVFPRTDSEEMVPFEATEDLGTFFPSMLLLKPANETGFGLKDLPLFAFPVTFCGFKFLGSLDPLTPGAYTHATKKKRESHILEFQNILVKLCSWITTLEYHTSAVTVEWHSGCITGS